MTYKSSHVWPTICISCFHNRKVENILMCPSFWPPAQPWGMNPGAKTHGMEADPPRYPWSKYESFLMSGWWDIPHSRNFDINVLSKFHECDGQTNEWTNEQMERRKLYTPRHKCQNIQTPTKLLFYPKIQTVLIYHRIMLQKDAEDWQTL